ncbi:MAG: hypothetical protein KKA79_03005 [Nanoarchaeota archaeon]|nr:hypothetical protein [Nanoarchaeota archaeon]
MEENKKSTLVETLTKAYMESKKDPAALKKIESFDELRQVQYEMQLERLKKEKDPADYHHQASRLFGQIKQEAAYFVGKDLMGDRFADMDFEEQMQHYVAAGTKAMGDIMHPDK